MTTANCPSCGAQVEFAIGSSSVVVCKFCRTLVARTDRGVADDGKVAALVDTGSPLHIGLAGKYHGSGFRLTGRTQMQHQAGGVWDEWYAAFDDGRWGWLAEAQGKFYVTFRTGEVHGVPAVGQLHLGAPVAQIDNFVVAEIGTATLAAAEGELPWRPVPGETYRYADLSGRDRRFATIDYSEAQPIVFKGTEATLPELGIASGEVGRQVRVAVTKLSCSNCGGPLELRAPDRSERIFCPNCGAAHDISQGTLQYLGVLQAKKVTPRIPLGKTGTIDGALYVVAGFMQRSVTLDGETYYWTEYLLYNRDRGFAWLVDSDDHWSFGTPIGAGDVTGDNTPPYTARVVYWQNKSFRLFQVANAVVEFVLGEFYWKVAVGEVTGSFDYINPPLGLSKEVTKSGAQEVNWTAARYVQTSEIESAFGVKVPRPVTIGSLQPVPATDTAKIWAVLTMAMFVLSLIIAVTRADKVLYKENIAPNAAEAAATTTAPVSASSAHATSTVFTPEFMVSGGQNIAISAFAPIQNTWAYVGGDLMNVDTGAIETFEMPIEYYEGYDGGDHWTEGSNTKVIYISAPPKGRYTIRLEAQWEKSDGSPITFQVREGVFRWSHLFAAFIVLSVPALFTFNKARAFEAQRWAESDLSGADGGIDK